MIVVKHYEMEIVFGVVLDKSLMVLVKKTGYKKPWKNIYEVNDD